jgi:hypothetical protein
MMLPDSHAIRVGEDTAALPDGVTAKADEMLLRADEHSPKRNRGRGMTKLAQRETTQHLEFVTRFHDHQFARR